MPTAPPHRGDQRLGGMAKTGRKSSTGRGPPCGARARKSLRSLPAVKQSPAPWISTARTPASSSAARSASANAAYIAVVSAFFFSGRFMRMRGRALPFDQDVAHSQVPGSL